MSPAGVKLNNLLLWLKTYFNDWLGVNKSKAERKMGEMLAVKPPAIRGKPGTGRGKKGSTSMLPAFSDDTPTLAELGLTKKESAEAQMLAGSLPGIGVLWVRMSQEPR